MKKILLLLIAFSVILIISCRLEVPVKEMSDAKRNIKGAYEVKADKYDPDNLKRSESLLLSSHDQLKKGNTAKAKDEAISSHKASTDAINNSLPKLAADTLKEAKDLISETEKLNAEIFSPEEYKTSIETAKNAETLNSEKKYWDSYQESKKAIAMANLAKAICMENAASIKEKIKTLKGIKTELESSKWAEEIKEELSRADTNIKEAETSAEAGNIKAALPAISKAEQELSIARKKMYSISFMETITVMKEDIKNLKTVKGTESAAEDIEKASVSLTDAEALVNAEKFDDIPAKLSEAEKSIANARYILNSGFAKERIAAVDAQIIKLSAADNKKIYSKDIEDARQINEEAKILLTERAIELSVAKADDAEALLNSIAFAMQKDYGTFVSGGSSAETTGQEKTYVVKYRKKNTDCLWRISLFVYKDAKLWPLIYMANKNQIKDPDLIFPGQKFIIPPIPKKSEPPLEDIKDEKKSKEAADLQDTSEKKDDKTSTEEIKSQGDSPEVNKNSIDEKKPEQDKESKPIQ